MTAEEIPAAGLSAFIADLAKRHGVTHVRDGHSALAVVVTCLADDDYLPDRLAAGGVIQMHRCDSGEGVFYR